MADKHRVVFVDDEPRILSGLRRALRSLHHDWDMVFAPGGQEALEALESACPDVLVTDMRMPVVDGCALLRAARERCAQTVRLALSGHADRRMVIDAAAAAHQYLSKPCDTDSLKNALQKAAASSQLLPVPALRAFVAQVPGPPVLPNTKQALVAVLEEGTADIDTVAHIVAGDLGLSAKVLHLVHSGFSGTTPNVCTPQEATAVLGIEMLRAMAHNCDVINVGQDLTTECPKTQRWTEHSQRIAERAMALAMERGLDTTHVHQAYTAGLLHDVGQLLLVQFLGDRSGAIGDLVANGLSLSEAERQVAGATHAQVGAYLLSIWGFPLPIVRAVTCHDTPFGTGQDADGILQILSEAMQASDRTNPDPSSYRVARS